MGREALDQLAAALAAERRALLEQDVPQLLDSSHAKRAALQALQADPPHGQGERLAELFEENQRNGTLLTRRRREVDLLLQHLGLDESVLGYDAQGQSQKPASRRVRAVA